MMNQGQHRAGPAMPGETPEEAAHAIACALRFLKDEADRADMRQVSELIAEASRMAEVFAASGAP